MGAGLRTRLRTAAGLVSAGLLAQMGTLLTPHPTAFLVFILVVGSVVGAGVLLYLHTLVSS